MLKCCCKNSETIRDDKQLCDSCLVFFFVYSLTPAHCSMYWDGLFDDLSLFLFKGNFSTVGGPCPLKGPVMMTFFSLPFIYLDVVQVPHGS